MNFYIFFLPTMAIYLSVTATMETKACIKEELPNSMSGLHIYKNICKVVIYNYVLWLALFHDKKYCNCFNFVLCILWDFIVLGLVLSW